MIIAVPSRFSCSAYTSVQDGIWNSEYVVSYARKMHYPRNLYIGSAVFRVHKMHYPRNLYIRSALYYVHKFDCPHNLYKCCVIYCVHKMSDLRILYIVNAVFRVHTFSLTLCRRSYGFCLFNVSVQVTFIYKKWLSYADDAQFTTGDHLTDHPNGFVQIVSNL